LKRNDFVLFIILLETVAPAIGYNDFRLGGSGGKLAISNLETTNV
jgi:hypothetical protein